MKAEEEILIQNKIDGILSKEDDAKFARLIDSSEEARAFYNQLRMLDEELKQDAKTIPDLDLTKSALQTIYKKENIEGKTLRKVIKFPLQASLLLKYAAILIIGLLVGSLITVLITNNAAITSNRLISGTIGKPEMTGEIYNNEGTRINVQQMVTTSIHLIVVDIESGYNITCRIKNSDLGAKNVEMLSGNRSSFGIENDENALLVHCSSAIYQIRTTNDRQVTLEFYFNSQLLRKISLGEGTE